MQDRPPQPQPISQSPPPEDAQSSSSSNSSTARKPSIMGSLLTGIRPQPNDAYNPSPRKPLKEQLQIFDVLDLMGPDPNRNNTRQSSSGSSFDQESLFRSLINTPLPEHGGSLSGPAISLRLRPSLGRTQSLDLTRNVDLTRAFQQLERKCTNNNVKTDERTQRIYVRRGQRRKEERSRRWRKLFKEGFLHECGRIRRMKAQGW